MSTIIFMFGLFLIIFLEAVTDALTYTAWIRYDTKSGKLAHVSQIVLMLSCVAFGAFIISFMELTFVHVLIIFFTAVSFHMWLFDIMYEWLSEDKEQGSNSFWDLFAQAIGMRKHPLLWSIIKGLLAFVMLVLSSTILQ